MQTCHCLEHHVWFITLLDYSTRQLMTRIENVHTLIPLTTHAPAFLEEFSPLRQVQNE